MIDKKYLRIPKCIDLKKIMTIDYNRFKNAEITKGELLYAFMLFVKRSFCDAYEYSVTRSENNNICAFYGRYWFRQDHKETFEHFYKQFDYIDRICSFKKNNKSLHFFRGLKKMLIAIIWLLQSVIYEHSITFAFLALPYLEICHSVSKCHWIKEINRYRLCVVYSELTPDENYIVQYAKSLGIKTATMQHGVFVANENGVLNQNRGVQLSESIADYFLAWNRFTLDNAIKCGMQKEKIKVIGIPKYVTYEKTGEINCETGKGIFGIVLNGYTATFHNNNIKMIEVAEQISEHLGMSYVLRYHPDMNGNEYVRFCGKHYAGNCEVGTSITDYIDTVDFSIVDNSTVFIEMVFMGHKVYKYHGDDDVYSAMKLGKFSTMEEFCVLYNNSSETNEKVFKYLCTTTQIKESYEGFFREFR